MPKAVIVGAGINGLCAARSLCKRGWQVEVIEAGKVPNPRAASWDRHRLLRLHYAEASIARRIPAAMEAWNALWQDLGRNHLVESGVLALSRVEGDWSERTGAALAQTEFPLEFLEVAEIARRFPMLEVQGVRHGLWTPRGGALLADLIVTDLADWLRSTGVVFRPDTPIEEADPATGEVRGPTGLYSGDVTILAAGVGLPRLVPELAGDLTPFRCTTVYLHPSPAWAEAWATGPAWVDLGGDDILWGLPPTGDIPMKLGYGLETRPGDPQTERDAGPEDVARIVGAYRGRFRDIKHFKVSGVVANFYLAAADERFVLRQDRRLVVLSADSGHGFKFGPLTGEELADAVEAGSCVEVARRMGGLEL